MTNAKSYEELVALIARQLQTAVDALVQNLPMSKTAEACIHAIEAAPGSGRVAILLTDDRDKGYTVVAAPSFSAQECESLVNVLANTARDERQSIEVEADLPTVDVPRQTLRLFPLSVEGERPTTVLVTARDMSGDTVDPVLDSFIDQISRLAGVVVEDRRLRIRMAEQQSIMSGIVAAAPDAIIRIDRYGTILDFAAKSEKLFGYSADEVTGRNVSILMSEPYASHHDRYIDAFLETGTRKLPDFGRRLQAKRKDGSLFWVEIALSHIYGQGTAEFVGVVRDITRRLETEAEAEKMREALDAAARQSSLGELAASIAHELNQPLTAIANFMDAVELRLRSGEVDKKALIDIAKKAGAQARLGGEIVRRTRRLAVHGETEPKVDDLHASVGEAISILRNSPLAEGVDVQHHMTGDEKTAAFDRINIQQVVTNLAANALRAMADQTDARLIIETNVRSDHVELIVSDNGPGIADEDKPSIFDRFYTKTANGMGLGLAIVKRIAEAHQGSISVEDNQGGGAVMRMSFPRFRASDEVEAS